MCQPFLRPTALPQRSSNCKHVSKITHVMYEVGLAHSIRQSSEIVMVRTDNEDLNFDIAGIRVHMYDPSDLCDARRRFSFLTNNSLRAIDREKGLIVERAIARLDRECLQLMQASGTSDRLVLMKERYRMPIMTETLAEDTAIRRLLDLGIVRCEFRREKGDHEYPWTPFGEIVLKRLGFR